MSLHAGCIWAPLGEKLHGPGVFFVNQCVIVFPATFLVASNDVNDYPHLITFF